MAKLTDEILKKMEEEYEKKYLRENEIIRFFRWSDGKAKIDLPDEGEPFGVLSVTAEWQDDTDGLGLREYTAVRLQSVKGCVVSQTTGDHTLIVGNWLLFLHKIRGCDYPAQLQVLASKIF